MDDPSPDGVSRWFGPLPTLREASAVGLIVLAVGLTLCSLSLYHAFRGEAFLGKHAGGDFVEFYSAARILNEYGPSRLYDQTLLARVEHESAPGMAAEKNLSYVYTPCVAALFRPLARLPYAWACSLWLVGTLVVYGVCSWLLMRGFEPACARAGWLLLCSTANFLIEDWIGGQLAVIAFVGLTLFALSLGRERRFWAGVALSLMALKPTLIAVPAAVLVLGGAWRMLAGLASGASVIGVASLATAGWQGCLMWVQTLRAFGQDAASGRMEIPIEKYIDVNSFFRLLLRGPSRIAAAAALMTAAGLLAMLAREWWRARGAQVDAHRYLWAGTIAWTLALNLYVPIYDTVAVGVAVVLAAGPALREATSAAALARWIMALYLAAWVTQASARWTGLQLYTLALIGFGWWALARCREARRPVEPNAQV
jgi:hypothetical protein